MVVCHRDRWVKETNYTNLTTIFVTEMVVCHKDGWVKGNRTIYLLYFLIYLQITNALQYFKEYPKRTSWGLQIQEILERESGFLGPFWTKL